MQPIKTTALFLLLFLPFAGRTQTTTPAPDPSATPSEPTVTAVTSAATTNPPAIEETANTTEPVAPRIRLVPRNQSQHTLFADAGYLAILSTIHVKASDSGSLNEGFDLALGYNWTSRRGLGVGVIYSGGFISARRDGISRTSRLHYIAPEFVARQQAGRRWIFREAAGIGYGRYVRSYGDTRAGRGGVGLHERTSVEYMLTRWLGLSAEIRGQWLIVGSPDVGDGVELNIGGVLSIQFGGGIRLYF